jgi:hypothetical protein
VEHERSSASDRARELQAHLDELQTCIDVGNEERFVKLVKLGKPGLASEQLNAMIEEFRAIRRNRSRR